MKHDTVALIRVALLVVFILAFVSICIIEAGSVFPREDLEKTMQEPQTTTEPTSIIPTHEEKGD